MWIIRINAYYPPVSEETFHSRLRTILKARNIKQVAVSHALNVSRYTVRRWCQFKMPDPNQLATLAAYLDTSVSHLLHGDSVDAKRIARCHYLLSLATELDDRHIEAMIALAEGLAATKMLQTSTD